MQTHTLDVEELDSVTLSDGGHYATVMDSFFQVIPTIDDDLHKTDHLVLLASGHEIFRGPITGWEVGSDTIIYARTMASIQIQAELAEKAGDRVS
jgi:hypothetical protein